MIDNKNEIGNWKYGELLIKEGELKKGLQYIKNATGFIKFYSDRYSYE